MGGDAFKLDKFVSCSRGTEFDTATVILFGLLVLEVALHRKDGVAYTVLPRGCRLLDKRIVSRFNVRVLTEMQLAYPELFRPPPAAGKAAALYPLSRSVQEGDRYGQKQR
jgi:hypothetical protein